MNDRSAGHGLRGATSFLDTIRYPTPSFPQWVRT